MLLLVFFLAMCWCLVEVEQEGREPKGGKWRWLVYALLAGLFLGLGSLTRYSFMILAIPVLMFFIIWGGTKRWQSAMIAAVVFAAIVSPWITRNINLSGAPFGTATYALVENYKYSEYQLQRNFNPALDPRDIIPAFWSKLLMFGRTIVTQEVPKMGGNWIGGFFLVGLLMVFRNPAINRFRLFLLGGMAFLLITQAVIRTQQSGDNPEINGENMLILAAPLILIYGVAFFMVLLDNLSLPVIELRYMIIGLFGAVMCLPLFLFFLPPRPYNNVAFPPYFPQSIQRTARFLTPNEMMMADVPWATAWYGQRQSVWTTQTITDFFKINDTWKPIQALYLSPVTLDAKFASSFVNGTEKVWANTFTQAIFGADLRQREWPRRISLQFTEGDKKLVMPLSYWQSGWPNFFIVTFRREEL
jgi:4-amino-4-deoxy-L-arabinose transferase-like glycosyltransferase